MSVHAAVDCDRWTLAVPTLSTLTTEQQGSVEERCLRLFTAHMKTPNAVQREEVRLAREAHIAFLLSGLEQLSSGYQSLDASRPWLCFWILHGLDLLGHELAPELGSRVVAFLGRCQDPAGGYCGGPFPGQLAHLAPTYAAVNALVIVGTEEAYRSIDRVALARFLKSRKHASGFYTMHDDGEIDIRGAYTAIAVGTLTHTLSPELSAGTADWIGRCQTYEGGLGGEPGLEAHGGYTFCGVAALSLLGRVDAVQTTPLLRWLAGCQKRLEGGFEGRTNKLVDGCYSFWQGASFALLHPHLEQSLVQPRGPVDSAGSSLLHALQTTGGSWLFDQRALQDYLLVCGQSERGGMRDKPGKEADFYHTCYCLSGLSVSQHSPVSQAQPEPLTQYGQDALLRRIDHRYNISQYKVDRALRFFSEQPPATSEMISVSCGCSALVLLI